MKKLVAALLLLTSSTNGVQQHQPPQEARDEVEMGLKAHKQSHFQEAKEHFQRALAIDKDFCWARLYLAGSFGLEYVPYVNSADNLAKAKQALDYYQAAMQCDPALSSASLIGMASLKANMEQWAEARGFYRQLLKIEGNYRDFYYAIAEYDLEEAFANTRSEKARLGLKPDQSLADDPACPALRKRNLPLVEDGLEMLSKAMWLHTADDGGDQVTAAVLYNERAEIECGDPEARKADKKNAAFWTDLAAKAAGKNAEAGRKCESGRVVDGKCLP